MIKFRINRMIIYYLKKTKNLQKVSMKVRLNILIFIKILTQKIWYIMKIYNIQIELFKILIIIIKKIKILILNIIIIINYKQKILFKLMHKIMALYLVDLLFLQLMTSQIYNKFSYKNQQKEIGAKNNQKIINNLGKNNQIQEQINPHSLKVQMFSYQEEFLKKNQLMTQKYYNKNLKNKQNYLKLIRMRITKEKVPNKLQQPKIKIIKQNKSYIL